MPVHSADIQDRDGAPDLLKTIRHRWPWLLHVFADGGYAGSDEAKGFEVLSRRWGSNGPSPGSADAADW